MKAPGKAFWDKLARFSAGAQVVINLGTAPIPPRTDPPSRQQHLHSLYAKNEHTNIQPGYTRRAVELGYHLQEPNQAEHRPPQGWARDGLELPDATRRTPHDSFDVSLARTVGHVRTHDNRGRER